MAAGPLFWATWIDPEVKDDSKYAKYRYHQVPCLAIDLGSAKAAILHQRRILIVDLAELTWERWD